MKIQVIAVGKLKERFWREAVEEYLKRLSRFCQCHIVELPEGKTIAEEGKEILKKATGVLIVTDIEGALLTSEQLAENISDRLSGGVSEFTFVIGSSEGLAEEVKARADYRLSFGRMTFPHQLMRVILLEQIYRTVTIMNRLPYHK